MRCPICECQLHHDGCSQEYCKGCVKEYKSTAEYYRDRTMEAAKLIIDFQQEVKDLKKDRDMYREGFEHTKSWLAYVGWQEEEWFMGLASSGLNVLSKDWLSEIYAKNKEIDDEPRTERNNEGKEPQLRPVERSSEDSAGD